MKNPIAVIGLGHVGLTLSLTLAEEGFTIIGVEKSTEVLKHLKKDEVYHFAAINGTRFFYEKPDQVLKINLFSTIHLPREVLRAAFRTPTRWSQALDGSHKLI